MYSPKIKEELIPVLYQISKALRKPMTRVVNEFIEEGLKKIDVKEVEKQMRDREVALACFALLCVLGGRNGRSP
jgi:hypothetical protein